jgi:hypothetical protein
MITSPDNPMDAVYHTLRREVAAIQERAQWAQRLHHLTRPGSQHERAGHEERGGRAGRGVPLGTVHPLTRTPSQNDPW